MVDHFWQKYSILSNCTCNKMPTYPISSKYTYTHKTDEPSLPGGVEPLLQDTAIMLTAGESLLELADAVLELVNDGLVVGQGQIEGLHTLLLVGFLLLRLL